VFIIQGIVEGRYWKQCFAAVQTYCRCIDGADFEFFGETGYDLSNIYIFDTTAQINGVDTDR
jgi:hypothetical protein